MEVVSLIFDFWTQSGRKNFSSQSEWGVVRRRERGLGNQVVNVNTTQTQPE